MESGHLNAGQAFRCEAPGEGKLEPSCASARFTLSFSRIRSDAGGHGGIQRIDFTRRRQARELAAGLAYCASEPGVLRRDHGHRRRLQIELAELARRVSIE